MLHKDHGGLALQQQGLDLHSGIDIDKIEWFVPQVQMGVLTQAAGNEDLLFLSSAVVRHVLFKLRPLKVQLPQYRLEEALVNPALPRKAPQIPPQEGAILGDIRYLESPCAPQCPGVWKLLTLHQLQKAGLARSVGPLQDTRSPRSTVKETSRHTGPEP